MLILDWNMEDALAVRYEEGKEEVARNAFAIDLSIEVIHNITGLDMETLKKIQERNN